VRFFFDNNISPKIAHALNCLVQPQHEVVHLRDRFDPATPDKAWMTKLANEMDWVIISADTAISRNRTKLKHGNRPDIRFSFSNIRYCIKRFGSKLRGYVMSFLTSLGLPDERRLAILFRFPLEAQSPQTPVRGNNRSWRLSKAPPQTSQQTKNRPHSPLTTGQTNQTL
jgi:hypothetical protein